MRTDQNILDQTNRLAWELYKLRGYTAKVGYPFHLATHGHEVEAWNAAVIAQEMLTKTDLSDVLANLEIDV